MEFLKAILGEELYSHLNLKSMSITVQEANKDKQVKIGNISTGEYVNKSDYDALNETLKGKETELATANTLIADLKKATNGNEDLQAKISGYETVLSTYRSSLKKPDLNPLLKSALLSAKAADVDYLTFKLNENGDKLELDENGNIKGWEDKLSGLKTQFPNMFESGENKGGFKVLGDNRLPGGREENTLTKNEILKKPYAERAALYAENPDAYNEAMKN